MKKIIVLLAFAFLMQITGFTQRNPELKERIESMRVAHISSAINLSSEQAQVFWPIYNEYKTEEDKLKEDRLRKKRIAELSEEEAGQMINTYFDNQAAKLALERKYIDRFRQVLSNKQLLQLTRAEKEFNLHLLKRIQERRKGKGFR